MTDGSMQENTESRPRRLGGERRKKSSLKLQETGKFERNSLQSSSVIPDQSMTHQRMFKGI